MEAPAHVGSIKKHFRGLQDPRVVGRSRHLLVDIIVLAICGVIGNCDDWSDIVLYAQQRLAWFQRFLKLPHGIPSHDTFERVFAALDPRAFECCCLAWLHDVAQLVGVGHIAIDGKTLRGSAGSPLGALHLVSAWATQAQLTLGQVAVDGKSNEITAIPKLLALLDLQGALVTIDAIGCQKAIAKQIVDGGGDYLLIVKGNQERLLADIQETVNKALDGELPAGTVRQSTTTERDHGRQEERSCVMIQHVADIRDRLLWLPRGGAAGVAGGMEARLPAAGGWLGQGCRRQYGILAICFAPALSRDEPLPVPGGGALSGRCGACAIPAGVQHAPGAAIDPAARGVECG